MLSTGVTNSPSVEVFKTRLDGALSQGVGTR